MHLPAGDATVSFHTQIVGSSSGAGLPIPDLSVTITPPSGVAKPELVENIGATTTVNNDAHRQVWVAHIPETGDYVVTTDGKVSAFLSPRLAFGHGSEFGYPAMGCSPGCSRRVWWCCWSRPDPAASAADATRSPFEL